MAKKGKKPVKTCADCIHEFACSMWNIGHIHDMDATNCTNHETVKDSSSYFIGFSDGQKSSASQYVIERLQDLVNNLKAVTKNDDD